MKQNVALVLSSGGPRGFAYIGAIEELLRRGYNITSVAGTSMGSLIGGIYASGRLPQIKDWLYTLDAWKVFTLMDLSISKNHIVKGDRVIEAIKEIVPDIDIEDLRIPFKAIATDLYTGEEVVFDKGNLFQAIRASISIPSLFRPVKYGYRTLIDGGIANAIPLNRVERNGNDILVAFDVNDVDVDGITKALEEEARIEEDREERRKEMSLETQAVIDSVKHDDSLSLIDKVRLAGLHGYRMLKDSMKGDTRQADAIDMGENYYTILSRTFSLMNHVNSEMSIKMYKPDILVKMPFDAYGEISDYAKAREISEAGRELMKKAIDKYEEK